jgi:hypothetical protein
MEPAVRREREQDVAFQISIDVTQPRVERPEIDLDSGIEIPRDEFRTNIEPVTGIHREYVDGCPPRWSEADDESASQREMVGPAVDARVEQREDSAAIGIHSCEVRSLVRVAMDAGQREIGGVVAPTVLPRDDVLDVMGGLGVFLLVETVFTAVAGALADELRGTCVHQLPPWATR